MKYKVTIILILVLCFSICNVYAEDISITEKMLTINVNTQEIQIYAYTLNDESYFMLRDIAQILSNTNKQIDITWDQDKNAVKILSNKAYTSIGNELKSIDNNIHIKVEPSPIDIYLDEDKLDITAYKINGSNYLRLQDIMMLLDVCLIYDDNNIIGIDTSLPYDKNAHIFYPSNNVVVLLYHNFINDVPSQEQYYITVSRDKFEADIKAVLEKGYYPLSLENYYLNNYNKNKKYFVITFDDGYLSNFEIAYPIIQKYKIFADIFINTDNIYMDHHFKLEQAKEMEDSGLVKIYSHYPIHIDVRDVEAAEYTGMLKKSIETLETVLDIKEFYFFAYPYGYYNDEKYNLTKDANFKLQAVQTVSYNHKDIVKRYNVAHITDILKLISNIVP